MSLLKIFIQWWILNLAFPKRGINIFSKIFTYLKLSEYEFLAKTDRDIKIKVKSRDWIQKHILFKGEYDTILTSYIKNNIKNDFIAIDAGANIGYFSLLLSKYCKNGHVYSFEPDVYNLEALKNNIDLNDKSNITINNTALWYQSEKLNLYRNNIDNCGMSSLKESENYIEILTEINAISLDGYFVLNKIKGVNFIKIDIEGAEFNALKGMKSLIQKHKPIIVIEIEDQHLSRFGHKKYDIYNFFYNLNYTAYSLDINGKKILLKEIIEGSSILFEYIDNNIN